MDKKKIMAPVVLFAICAVIGILMAVINSFTAPKIEENTINAQKEILKAFYSDMTEYKEVTDVEFVDYVVAKYEILNDTTTIGYVYKASGNNSYGNITMLVAVTDGKISGVDYLNNEQTKNPNVIETVGTGYVGNNIDGDFTDTISGVTVGSKLVNKLMNAVKAQVASEGGNN